jgi:predicted MFS family arabinose efflux permease
MRDEIKEGLSFVVRHPILRKVVACTGTANLFISMGFALEMVYLIRVLHVKPGYVGLVFSPAAIGGMVGGLVAGPLAKRIGSARIIWFSPMVLGLPQFLVPLAQPGWGVLLYAGGLFFLMTAGVVYNVAQVSYRQAITPPELLGRMNASVRFIVWGTMPIGVALGGVLGSAIGVRETLWVSVIGAWCAGLWVFFSPLRRMRDVDIHEVYSPKMAVV